MNFYRAKGWYVSVLFIYLLYQVFTNTVSTSSTVSGVQAKENLQETTHNLSVVQQAYFKASNTEAGDSFGFNVALNGDTLVVGAPVEASAAVDINGDQTNNAAPSAGAVYVFIRENGTWRQQAYLKASNTETEDYFGTSVILQGNTLVVSAPFEDSASTNVNGDQTNNAAPASGAVYVFERTGETWYQQAYLKASNAEAEDYFGSAMALHNDTLVIGSRFEDSAAVGINGDQTNNAATNSGAVYVFERDPQAAAGSWTQQAYLKASNTEAQDGFGASVAFNGDILVVGATGESSATSGINGDQANNAAAAAGAVYVFTRDPQAAAGSWTQQAYVKASNTNAGDFFGGTIALDAQTLVVGATGEASAAMGVAGDQTNNAAPRAGAVYIFVYDGTTWSQQAYLKASNTDANDLFGFSVALDHNTLVVGAWQEASVATGINGAEGNNDALNAGAVYMFERTGEMWRQQTYLKASNTDQNDLFGWVTALDSATLVVGAWGESSSASGINGDQSNNAAIDAGSVYVFDITQLFDLYLPFLRR